MTVLRARRSAQSIRLVAALLASAMLATLAAIMLGPASYACACGALVAPSGERATMNHEVALVHWDGTTETILMQLAVDASTSNVALVVPTPAPATVTAGDRATFVELDSLTAPQVQQRERWKLRRIFGELSEAPSGAHAPNVINQVQLGPLQATTLAGGDLTGLQKWLADNGYSIRPEVTDALGPYVKDGWSFVSMRLTSSTPIVGGLNPVQMTFPSSRLVYPMRLSVAAPSPQEVTVYTLSDHRQQRTDADAAGQAGQATTVEFAGNVATAVHDPLLRELTGNHGGYLTKISVNIPKPSQISSDFTFGNAPNDDAYRQVVYQDHDVVIPIELLAFAGVVILAIAGTVTTRVVRRRRRRQADAGPA
jgi:hypothetical protein